MGEFAMVAPGAARFTKHYVVVRIADEVIIDLMGRACGLTPRAPPDFRQRARANT
jgi:hypothetical protein